MVPVAAFELDRLELPTDATLYDGYNKVVCKTVSRFVPLFIERGGEDEKYPERLAEAMTETLKKADYTAEFRISKDMVSRRGRYCILSPLLDVLLIGGCNESLIHISSISPRISAETCRWMRTALQSNVSREHGDLC